MKSKGSGWKGESRRHSLARKGIRTVPRRSMGKKQRYLKNSRGNRVFTGKVSEQMVWFIMNNESDIDYSIPYEDRKHIITFPEYEDYSGYHIENGGWVAWDNSFGELAVESFDHKEIARIFATELDLTHSILHYVDYRDEYFENGKLILTIDEIRDMDNKRN